MSEVCQVKIYLLGKLQEKLLTRSIVKVTQLKEVKFYRSPRNNSQSLNFRKMLKGSIIFLSLDYPRKGLSSSSESEEEESREYNEAV